MKIRKKDKNTQPQEMGTSEEHSFFLCFYQKEDGKKPNPLNRFIGVAVTLIFAFACCLSTEALAGDWRIVPKIGLYGGYDDNVLFGRNNKISSSVVIVEPALEIDYQSLLSQIHLKADYDIISYLDESDLDRVNQYYRLDGNHRLGQRWDLRAGLRFINDTTLNTYLEETGRVIERLDREYFNATGGVSYDISNISSIDTDYRYEKVRYEDDRFGDFERHRLDLKYRHRLKSQQDVLSIGPSFYHRTNDRNDTDYVSLDLGWKRDWSQITDTFVSIGPRYTNVENKNGVDKDTWGVRALFDLTHKGIASQITFRYYHDLRTTAAGKDVNVDNLFLGYNYRLTERFDAGINGRLVFSYNLFSDVDDEDRTRYYVLEPFLNYRLTKKLNVSLHYSYQNSSQDIIDSENAKERNRVWIQIKYGFPMML